MFFKSCMMDSSSSGVYHLIAGFGNPLVDISVFIDDDSTLKEYNLEPDGQKEVNSEELYDLLDCVRRKNYNISKRPGGCTQNTLRVVQSLVKRPKFSVFFGGLGNDDDGKYLESKLFECGIDTRYAKQPEYSTGKVAALINGKNRSLVAHLGAAEIYTMSDFSTCENLRIMEEVVLVYIEGFFITHSFDVAVEVISLCKRFGVTRVFNISGAYVAKTCPNGILRVAKDSDVVIGNSGEFKAIARLLDVEDNLSSEELTVKVHSALWSGNTSLNHLKLHHFNSIGKTVVMTDGENPVIYVGGDMNPMSFPVSQVDAALIKDPTGAGDAFAAGFLVALISNNALYECLRSACDAALKSLQRIGV